MDEPAAIEVPARHPQARLSPEERKAIQLAFLEDTGISRRSLSERFKVDRDTVSRCLRGDDFAALERAALEERKSETLSFIKKNAKYAADEWIKAMPKAGQKGNHKPMEDWLKAGGIIENTDQPRIVVQVGVKLTGAPEL